MQWIAQKGRDSDTDAVEQQPWDAADHIRANSGLSMQSAAQAA
jgi:hypothetical protein